MLTPRSTYPVRILHLIGLLPPLVAAVFAPNLAAKATRKVSLAYDGAPLEAPVDVRGITGDGSRLVVDSTADRLVPGDTNGVSDVFVIDVASVEATLVSRSSDGTLGNGASRRASISDGGRWVAFVSSSTNLVPGDTNGVDDVFVHDMETGETVRVSLRNNGSELQQDSNWSAISVDGRHVAFDTRAKADSSDGNRFHDVYVRDRDPDENGVLDEGNARTVRVSVSASGAVEDGGSFFPSMSGDGRFLTWHSEATNLVAGDTNGAWDVFLRDRDPDGNGVLDEGNASTTRLSRSSSGVQGNRDSRDARLSLDGRQAAFWSDSTNLVPGDTNRRRDAFAVDLATGRLLRVSVSTAGAQGNGESRGLSLSRDGRLVSFRSEATNLVPDDGNVRRDLFLRDRDPDGNGVLDEGNGTTERLSLSSFGEESHGDHDAGTLSSNGRYLAFESDSTDLVDGETGTVVDAFRRDLILVRGRQTGNALHLDVDRAFGHEGRPVLVATSPLGTRPGTPIPGTSLVLPLVLSSYPAPPGRGGRSVARVDGRGRASLPAISTGGAVWLDLAPVTLSGKGVPLEAGSPVRVPVRSTGKRATLSAGT